ncbi:MAG: hypothetical protein IJC64_02600 [Clostridia bacterium]|nr:hypothetical protein [Clostridia bacterium]
MNISDKFIKALGSAVSIAALVCTVCTSLLFSFGVRDDIYTPQSTDIDTDNSKVLPPTVDYGDIYLDHMIIFCDAVTYGIVDHDIIRDESCVITGSGLDMSLDYNTVTAETTKPDEQGKAQSIIEVLKSQRPQYVLISIGHKNGVEHCSEEKFKQYYTSLINEIRAVSPTTKIILQSVLPVSREISKKTPEISNEKIDRANGWILDLCSTLSLRYLNTAEVLKDEKGDLRSEYDGGDGMRLNEQGYLAMVEYIKTHGYK